MSTSPNTEPTPAAQRERGSDAIVIFGSRIGRDTVIYVAGTAAVLPFSLVTVAVLTRYLTPSDYGQLAILFVFASLLTTLYNLGSLQGVFIWVFGSSGEDEGIDTGKGAAAGHKREALGTGLVLTAGVLILVTLPAMVLAGSIGHLLLGEGDHTTAVRWAAASAALGSLWRLVVNLFRMERRPVTFAVLSTLRPAFVLACSLPLVAAGHGVIGAVAGTALGTAAGCAVCLLLGRRSFRLAFDLHDAKQIMRKGSRYIAVILGLWVAHNADVFVLAHFSSDADVGLYRLAGRVAVFVSYFVSAFLMAWAPLEATSLFRGVYERHGKEAVRSKMVTYYFVSALVLVFAMAISADVLIQIAAPSFHDAAPLIAPVAMGFVAYGGFIVIARIANIRHRNRYYGGTACACGLLMVVLGALLIPPLGAYGSALAVALAMTCGSLFLMHLISRGEEPVPFEFPRLIGSLALAAGCYLLAVWLGSIAGDARGPVEAGCFLLFILLLVVTDIVPRPHLRPMRQIAVSTFTTGQRRGTLAHAVRGLDSARRGAVEAVIRDRLPMPAAAARAGIDLAELHAALAQALRRISGYGSRTTPHDAAIGAYLLSREPPAERDAVAQRLWEEGVDPLELHEIETTYRRLTRLSQRSWSRLDHAVAN